MRDNPRVRFVCSSAVLFTAGMTELTGRRISFCAWKVVTVYQMNNKWLNHHCTGSVFFPPTLPIKAGPAGRVEGWAGVYRSSRKKSPFSNSELVYEV